jgi:hypothetical protein
VFNIGKIKDVDEVRFYLTVISGDCYMLVANSSSQNYDEMYTSMWNVVSFKESISNVYYLTIIASEQSYFMVNSHVIRYKHTPGNLSDPTKNTSIASDTKRGYVALEKDIAHTFTIDSSERAELYYGVVLSK